MAFSASYKPASASHDLVIVQRSEPLGSKIFETLQRKGFSMHIIADPKDAHQTLRNLANPILLVYCGVEEGCMEYISAYLMQPEIFDFPILVLGKDIEGVESELLKYFGLATTIKAPCAAQEVLDALTFVSRSYKRERARVDVSKNNIPQAETNDAIEVKVESEEKINEVLESDSATKTILHNFEESELETQSLGGSEYARTSKQFDLSQTELLPQDQALTEASLKLSKEAGKWGSSHIYRTAMLADKITSSLKIDDNLKESSKAAALLFAMAFPKKSRSLMRQEYMGRQSLLLRKEICSSLKDSAIALSLQHNANEEAKIVATMGRLVGKEEVANDDPVSVVASTIMACDLVDRICFQTGHWNSRAAYHLVKRIRGGKLREIHPNVLTCMMKLLSEAVSESSPAYLVARGRRENPELVSKAKEIQEADLQVSEVRIPLSALAPGMRLSRPIFTYDGKQILSEDLTLDHDLIWRIWQLSALRPVYNQVVVFEGH